MASIPSFLKIIGESLISLADVTTNNASTTKHGFLRKLSGSANDLLSGAGTWITTITGLNLVDPTITVASQTAQNLIYRETKALTPAFNAAAGTAEQEVTNLRITLPIINAVCTIEMEMIIYVFTVAGNNTFRFRLGTSTSYLTNTERHAGYRGGISTEPTYIMKKELTGIDLSTQNYLSVSVQNDVDATGLSISSSGERSAMRIKIYK